ncbi:hypothetical protein DFJ73DRAFT_856755 [Zopfochytrium polystomum]|nr:hypothetical protein DFJ73DRAFT_856755 [Zopfochytrium polystomum]
MKLHWRMHQTFGCTVARCRRLLRLVLAFAAHLSPSNTSLSVSPLRTLPRAIDPNGPFCVSRFLVCVTATRRLSCNSV